MTNKERVQMIQEARELILEAQDLVDSVVEKTGIEGKYKTYGSFGFDQLLNRGNPYDDGLDELEEYFGDQWKEIK